MCHWQMRHRITAFSIQAGLEAGVPKNWHFLLGNLRIHAQENQSDSEKSAFSKIFPFWHEVCNLFLTGKRKSSKWGKPEGGRT